MSPRRDKTVPQLVEKYRRDYPFLERPLLRKLMRLENPQLFKKDPSNLKKLDRHLKKAFENEEPSPKGPSKEQPSFWRKQAFEDFTKIRNALINQDPDEVRQIPEATLRCIETYPKLSESMSSEITELEKQINWAYKASFPDPYFRIVERRRRFRVIANTTVPKILKKAFKLLYES